MIVHTYRTQKVTVGDKLFPLLDRSLPRLREGNIVVVTSKIVSICQGQIVKNDGRVEEHQLIRSQSDSFITDKRLEAYDLLLTIKDHVLIPNAGVDESNGNGYFILWPKDIHKTTAEIWRHLKEKHKLAQVGVVITDSHTTPLRWGTTGIGLSWCGFAALNNYIGSPDIFGRKLRVTKASILDGLSAAAVVAMGEGNEQTPLAVISDAGFVRFQGRPPTEKEIQALQISLQEDIYAPLIDSHKWQKGE